LHPWYPIWACVEQRVVASRSKSQVALGEIDRADAEAATCPAIPQLVGLINAGGNGLNPVLRTLLNGNNGEPMLHSQKV
jgi:hypothetical protein